MNKEIEAKVRVASLDHVAGRLTAVGARYVASHDQHDVFFADREMKLIAAGCGLRIRRQKDDNGERALLTFKGPREKSRYKVRPEAEVAVTDADTMRTILDALGYRPFVEVVKRRQLWRLDDCEVCLDDVAALGSFVEVEGPNEQAVAAVLEKLGLADLEPITRGYASMVRQELIRTGKAKSQPVVDDEKGV